MGFVLERLKVIPHAADVVGALSVAAVPGYFGDMEKSWIEAVDFCR